MNKVRHETHQIAVPFIQQQPGDRSLVSYNPFTDHCGFTKTGIGDYQATEGNLGVQLLRRIEGEQAHFLIITFWESVDAIKKFAGEDDEKARYYPEDQNFLLEFEEKVVHYEVISSTLNSK